MASTVQNDAARESGKQMNVELRADPFMKRQQRQSRINGSCDIDEIAGGAEDKNANNLLDTCELATGDLNLDGQINGADLTTLLNFWGAVNPPAGDLNGDGVINGYDMTILLNNWGPG